MLLQRRGLTGQRYDLVDDDGASWGEVRLDALRQGGRVAAVAGGTWRIERDARFGPWRTRTDGDDATLVTTVKGHGRERYELDWDGGHLVLVRRRGVRPRRIDLLDGFGAVVGEVVRASMWRGTYELRGPARPSPVVATIAFLVVLLNRRDNAATWS